MERTPPTFIAPEPTAGQETATQTPAAEAASSTGCAGAPKPKAHAEPTRYGDWEIHGKCVDF